MAGGAVDAVIMMGFQILTAAQTGNTILFAVALASGDVFTGLLAGLSTAAFVGGALFCGFLLRFPKVAGAGGRGLLVLEIAMLTTAMLVWRILPEHPGWDSRWIVIFLSATAMGWQSMFVLARHGKSTTYMTGNLASFAEGLLLAEETKNQASPKVSRNGLPGVGGDRRKAWGLLGVWTVYLFGAVVAGVLYLKVGSWALMLPVLLLGVLAALSPGAKTQ